VERQPIIRKSFGLEDRVRPELKAAYDSPLIARMKSQGSSLKAGRFEIWLAEEFGFCYGVDRAVEYVHQTREKFPGRRIFLMDEIIHNPQVNSRLREMGIRFLWGRYGEAGLENQLTPEDVVVVPAFGATVERLEKLQAKGCLVVDTTCGSVMSVWKRVEAYRRDGFTAVIHGKYDHEETLATCSRAGKYVVVRDTEEAGLVCEAIAGRLEPAVFLSRLGRALSRDFDPARDLQKIGCANQTTMLSSESLEIARRLGEAIRGRFGEGQFESRFRHFDTICSATEDRQRAVMELIERRPDIMIVVGGYNSSNTAHLVEISSKACSTYHIDGADCLISPKTIRFKKTGETDAREKNDWLPAGPLKIGITAGASTPDRVVEAVILRLFEIDGVAL
jgi:4-hydroxy-3-methylbut-2-enyl diphosphate reductase